MKSSIISTTIATLLAASSAVPIDTTCQLQLNALRQFQVDIVPVTFYSVDGASFTQEFPDDAKLYPISKFIFFFLSFLFLLHSSWKRPGILAIDNFFSQKNPSGISHIFMST